MTAVTQQLYTLVYVFFLLTVTIAFLSLHSSYSCRTRYPCTHFSTSDFAATASFPFLKPSDFVSRYDVCIKTALQLVVEGIVSRPGFTALVVT